MLLRKQRRSECSPDGVAEQIEGPPPERDFGTAGSGSPASCGNELLGVVRESLEEVDRTVSRIRRSAAEASRSLSVGAPPLIAANVLPEAIKEFRCNRPDIHIQVFDVGGEALTGLVEQGKLDMSLGAFFHPAPGIRRTPLFRFSLSRLISPVVNLDFSRISLRGKRLPPGADGFTSFLQGYIARWAGRAGIL